MIARLRDSHACLKASVGSEKGISTIEWIGLTAVVLVLLSAIFVYVQLHGGQVGAAAGSSMDGQIALWQAGGGRVSAYANGSSAQVGSPLRGAPGLAPPKGGSGQVAGAYAGDPRHSVQGGADTRPGWRRLWDDVWDLVFPAALATGPEIADGTRATSPSLWARIWNLIRNNRLVSFVAGLVNHSSSMPLDQPTRWSDEEIHEDINRWLALHDTYLGDEIDEPPQYHAQCVALAKRLAPWIGQAGGGAENYLAKYQNRHGKPAPLLSESLDSVRRGSVLVEGGHVAIVAGWYNGQLYVVEQNYEGSPVQKRPLSDFAGIHWLPEP